MCGLFHQTLLLKRFGRNWLEPSPPPHLSTTEIDLGLQMYDVRLSLLLHVPSPDGG